jgi:hypothetical protein
MTGRQTRHLFFLAVKGRSPHPGQVLGGIDGDDVGEGLREVPYQTLGLGVVFLGQKANVVTNAQ